LVSKWTYKSLCYPLCNKMVSFFFFSLIESLWDLSLSLSLSLTHTHTHTRMHKHTVCMWVNTLVMIRFSVAGEYTLFNSFGFSLHCCPKLLTWTQKQFLHMFKKLFFTLLRKGKIASWSMWFKFLTNKSSWFQNELINPCGMPL
jgi:hypothetical protein